MVGDGRLTGRLGTGTVGVALATGGSVGTPSGEDGARQPARPAPATAARMTAVADRSGHREA
jgi:hypothetical protein